MRRKKASRASLVKNLDAIFSRYIRERDHGVCYTCGSSNGAQAGHYVSRSCYQLRWDERNVHCQCYRCNVPLHGNYIPYRRHLVEDYGEDVVRDLENRRHETSNYTNDDLIRMCLLYENKLEQLKS